MHNLNLFTHILAYDPSDVGVSNNPDRRAADWSRKFNNILISKPKSNVFTIEPGQSLSLFSGLRSTSIDGTTVFSVSLLPNGTSTYRFLATTGTLPAFRTARVIASDATSIITVALNNNVTATFTASGGTIASFATVQVGDIVRVGGVSLGDAAGPFVSANEGYWVVLAASATILTCKRLANAPFFGTAEVVVLGASFATNFIVYSAAGVQIGDKVDISSGFSPVTQKTFVVSQVAPLFVEVVSTDPIPLETGIQPTATGMVFYTASKKVVYVEVDTEALVQVNGYTGSAVRLSPFMASDPSLVASYQQVGNVWSLTIVNKSTTATLNGWHFLAE